MRKFAYIDFIQSMDEIPLKFKILNHGPQKILDWYIRKFIPFTIDQITVGDMMGYEVHIPILFEDVIFNEEKTVYLTERTLSVLNDYQIDIVVPPKKFPYEFPKIIPIADGKNLFPYFLMESILKALKLVGTPIKRTEILIIDGDRNLTESCIDTIYPHINYLSIMVGDIDEFSYSKKAHEVFADTGLNMAVTEKNKTILENADVIINTSSKDDQYDYYYKRNAIYFDLGTNQKKLKELAGKRPDLIIIDELRVKYLQQFITLTMFEPILYVSNREYRNLLNRGYNSYTAALVKQSIASMDVTNPCFSSTIGITSIKARPQTF